MSSCKTWILSSLLSQGSLHSHCHSKTRSHGAAPPDSCPLSPAAGVYASLLKVEGGEKDNEIARDLNRTYPTHVFYQQQEGAGQTSLYHVLKTYSVYDKKVSASRKLSSAQLSSQWVL